MSKRRGNMVDPWEVIDQHGADAFRWYLYTASPPGQERRFSADLVGEVLRSFTLTLWNVYSFFVTYANLDQWRPASPGQPGVPVEALPLPYSDLDRWLLSELHTLVRDVTDAMERYDVPGATRPIQAFVDRLSRWYLRRSRRRFWKSGTDADKQAAYTTLYETLVNLSKLLAPSMPFLADELYQNLVLSGSSEVEAPESVHLASWPSFDPERIDESLNRQMALVMQLASLGHAARNQAGIKVRQPLAEAVFSLGSAAEARVMAQYGGILAEELNVRQVRMLGSAEEVISYNLNPLPKQLGQKYTAKYPAIREAILALEAEQAAQALLIGEPVSVTVDGEAFEILPEEVEVRAQAHPGLVVASEGPYLAALKTDLTPELIREGLAREFVRRVQELRKQAGLEISNRIQLYASASPGLAEAIQEHRDFIMGETLSTELHESQPPAGATKATAEFEGEKVEFGLEKAT